MRRYRFLCPELPSSGGAVSLDSPCVHHAHVLRIEPGTSVELFDGQGRRAQAVTLELTATRFLVNADLPQDDLPESAIHLIQVVPKGRKLDDIVRMVTELGVCSVHLASSERSIFEPSSAKLERLQRIAEESARLAARAVVPAIHSVAPLGEVALRAGSQQRVLFWEEQRGSMVAVLEDAPTWVLVGPEGGLARDEVEPLIEAGWTLSGLGNTILRVQTAAAIAVALVRDRVQAER